MQGQKDDNGDKLFDGNDKTIPLVADIAMNKVAVEVFNRIETDTVKTTLLKIWKGIKK